MKASGESSPTCRPWSANPTTCERSRFQRLDRVSVGRPQRGFFQEPIEDEGALLIPALSLFEVYRHLVRHLGRGDALSVMAAMHLGTVVELDATLAMDAAELSIATQLALADSIILATAQAHGAVFWTQDADFEGMENVRLKRKGT
ncbi:MAG: type II toxin-antitoxin system VapC family toxin [Dehalococcoidia bacterium]